MAEFLLSVYRAWLKIGPQVAGIFQANLGRSCKSRTREWLTTKSWLLVLSFMLEGTVGGPLEGLTSSCCGVPGIAVVHRTAGEI